ncbi:MAG: hypothetical protein LBJ00_16210 [Planctomycetaceae bacterium]|jgi:hypothetical protein|nr:hypothetical protein [Planctomycetaceae bacterium]
MSDKNEEEFELEPIDDDDLELEPIVDDEAAKEIAPDIPFNAGVRMIPVICSACRTRLYAGEDQVGLWKRCPDCYRLTEIRAVAPRFILTADDPEAAGGYGMQNAEVSREDISQLRAKNLDLFETDQQKRNLARQTDHSPPPVFVDKQPVMEGILNSLLKSQEEKTEEDEITQRENKINNEVEQIKKANREGKLDEYLAGSQNDQPKITDPAERKRLEKQRMFDAATSSSLSSSLTSSPKLSSRPSQNQPHFSPPPQPPSKPSTSSTTSPPPLPSSTSSPTATKTLANKRVRSVVVSSSNACEVKMSSISLLSPLFDRRCRARMIILTICGLIGNFTGEKARSMIWQTFIDKVHDQMPGYVYSWAESGIFFVNFWFGVVLSVVWLSMLFLFGISFFDATAGGRDRVDRWVPFNLDFGFSYIGWSLFILFISGYPGFFTWHIFSFFLPESRAVLEVLLYVGQFFCFPILFLCVIESDTFFGNFPRKTLKSLYKRPLLWGWLYGWMLLVVGVPVCILLSLAFIGTAFDEYWFVHSLCYYIIVSVLLTFCGYFVLIYFRLLGAMAWEIDSKNT